MLFDIRQYAETASTNDDARQVAEAGAPAGTVVWALRQNAGRGRQGRQWTSPAGNLYCSVILRPEGGVAAYGLYSFTAALAICDGVRGFLPNASVELKWPNDVLVGGKKISGILLEAGDGFLVAGMGINVLHHPENPLYPTTSLAAETNTVPQLEVVLDRLLAALAQWAEILETRGFGPVRMAWLTRARKGAMRVRLPSGEIHGAFGGIEENGSLRLRLPDGTTRAIGAGDVFF